MNSTPFTIFGFSHILVIALTFIFSLIGLVPIIKNQPKVNQYIGYVLAGLLILQIIIFNLYHLFIAQDFNLASFLPFHLCSFSAYFTAIVLILNQPKLNTLQYYLCPVAALAALLAPDMGAGENFPAFRFIEFFWSHGFIVIGSVYIILTRKLIPKWQVFALACFSMLSLMAIAQPINILTGGNYFYLRNKPAGSGPMDWFGEEPNHIYGLILVGLFILFIQWLALKIWYSKTKKFNN